MAQPIFSRIDNLGRLGSSSGADAIAHVAIFKAARRQQQLLAVSASGLIRLWRSDGAPLPKVK